MANIQEPTRSAVSPVSKFRNDLEKFSGEIKAVLPSSVSLESFKRVVRTAVQNNPELLSANSKSLYNSCLECAKQGLLPDGKEGALVIFNGKNGKTVSFLPMVDGIIKQIWRSEKITYISANAVYQNDKFDYCLGDKEYVEHKPAMSSRGEVIAAYAIVKTKDNEFIRTVLTKDEIDKLRNSGRNADGDYWKKWYDQMAIKSAIHRLAKKLDLSVEYEVEDLNEIPYSPPPKLVAPEPEGIPSADDNKPEGVIETIKHDDNEEPDNGQPPEEAKPQKTSNAKKNPF
jgi:recombination protein RecT